MVDEPSVRAGRVQFITENTPVDSIAIRISEGETAVNVTIPVDRIGTIVSGLLNCAAIQGQSRETFLKAQHEAPVVAPDRVGFDPGTVDGAFPVLTFEFGPTKIGLAVERTTLAEIVTTLARKLRS